MAVVLRDSCEIQLRRHSVTNDKQDRKTNRMKMASTKTGAGEWIIKMQSLNTQTPAQRRDRVGNVSGSHNIEYYDNQRSEFGRVSSVSGRRLVVAVVVVCYSGAKKMLHHPAYDSFAGTVNCLKEPLPPARTEKKMSTASDIFVTSSQAVSALSSSG